MKLNLEILTIGAIDRTNHLILAHGAGAPMTSPFLTSISELLNKYEITSHRFEFPYMRERHLTGKRRPPPRIETLRESYLRAIQICKDKLPSSARLFIGGKSMGGRVATLVAAMPEMKNNIQALILLGYPFHPPQKPQSLRTKPFKEILIPTLIVQGTRDPFGTKEDVTSYHLPKSVKFFWIEDGDHDLKPRTSSGQIHVEALNKAAHAIACFVGSQRTGAPKRKLKES